MTDVIQGILTGLCTGIGIVIANWIGKKYIEPKLEESHNHIQNIKRRLKE